MSRIFALENLSFTDYLKLMGKVFVPYAGKEPASIDINGHRLIILTTEPDSLEEGLPLIGGDSVQPYSSFNNPEELKQASEELAKTCEAGVVIAPAGVELIELLRNLENQLPWIH